MNIKKILTLLAMALASAFSAHAEDKLYWTGNAGDFKWSSADNWTNATGTAQSPDPDTPYYYWFSGLESDIVVTQDVDVIANCIRVSDHSVEIAGKGSAKFNFDKSTTPILYLSGTLTLSVDMSDNACGKIKKTDSGTAVFNLRNANTTVIEIVNEGGLVKIAEGSVAPRLAMLYTWKVSGVAKSPVFENNVDGALLSRAYQNGGTSYYDNWYAIGRLNLAGKSLNIGWYESSSKTNYLQAAIFSDGGSLTFMNERNMFLSGLPIGGTLAVDRADVRVDKSLTAIRWLFDDETDPVKDVVGAGRRLLAPEGMPEVVDDAQRGKVLHVSDGKYFKGPDADAGFAELFPRSTNNAWTVAFWLKPDSGCDQQARLFAWGTRTSYRMAGLRLNAGTPGCSLYFTDYKNKAYIQTPNRVDDGNWHHFVATYNGGARIRFYYDGVPAMFATTDGGDPTSTYISVSKFGPPNSNFYIARTWSTWQYDGEKPYSGRLDDFFIGAYELDDEDVAKLYRDGLAAFVPTTGVEAKSGGIATFANDSVSLATLSGAAAAGGVSLEAEGSTLSVGVEVQAATNSYQGRIYGNGTTLVKEGGAYALELSGIASGVTNVEVKSGALALRRPLARKGLVCFYPFDDKDMQDIGFDASPSRLCLAQEGAGLSYVSDGVRGSAIRFSSDSYLTSGSEFKPSNFPYGTNSFTVSVWIRPDANSFNNDTRRWICGWGSSENSRVVSFDLESETKLKFSNYGSGRSCTCSIGTSLSDGEWHHIVLTYCEGAVKFYVDGSMTGSGSISVANVNRAPEFRVGSYANGNAYIGDMDEFMICDYAWSAGEVADEYAGKSTEPVDALSVLPKPVAHWTFDDGENVGADSSGNGIALTHDTTTGSDPITVESGASICGKAARFTTANGWLALAEYPALFPSGTTNFTVIARYRPERAQNGGSNKPGVVTFGILDSLSDNDHVVRVGSANSTYASANHNIFGTEVTVSGGWRTAVGSDNTRWTTAAVTFSAGEGDTTYHVRTYCDGVLVDDRRKTGGLGTPGSGIEMFYVGRGERNREGLSTAEYRDFQGLIDDVQIYNCSLSSGQIRLVTDLLEASKGTSEGYGSVEPQVLGGDTSVTVEEGARLRVASRMSLASVSGAGDVEIAPLAQFSVADTSGFTGDITGSGELYIADDSVLDVGDALNALEVDGTVRLGRNVTVRTSADLEYSSFDLVRAASGASFIGVENLSTWHVQHTKGILGSVSVRNNVLQLMLQKGMILLFR